MPELLPAAASSLVLIALAELGDKSQLVCMTLAARHRHWPVLLGAAVAFSLLNLLAVAFGAALASWVPQSWVAIGVASLFAAFGVHSLLVQPDETTDAIPQRPGYGIFASTLLLIFVAEFGDKTQLAVAGLAGHLHPPGVWLGATVALIAVSALGVWVGRKLLQKLPLKWLHRISGLLFLLFAALALTQL